MQTLLKLGLNPIQELKSIKEEIKRLQDAESSLKDQINNLMDQIQSDKLVIGEFAAKRSLVIQERLDSKKVKEVLGDHLKEYMIESSQVRLTII